MEVLVGEVIKLVPQNAIATIASESEPIAVGSPVWSILGIAAIEILNDEDGLAKVILTCRDNLVTKKAMDKLVDDFLPSNRGVLAEAAIRAVDPCTRSYGLEGLFNRIKRSPLAVGPYADQALLAKIGQESKDSPTRVGVVAMLKDRSILGDLAAQASDRDVRQAAKSRLEEIERQ